MKIDTAKAASLFMFSLREHKNIKAAEFAGFTFSVKDIEPNSFSGVPGKSGYYGHIDFKCVCGRSETPHFFIDSDNSKVITDAANHYAQLFEDVGAFSVNHLLEDGYTEDEANQIHSKYTAALQELS